MEEFINRVGNKRYLSYVIINSYPIFTKKYFIESMINGKKEILKTYKTYNGALKYLEINGYERKVN